MYRSIKILLKQKIQEVKISLLLHTPHITYIKIALDDLLKL